MTHHILPIRTYLLVFLALMVLLIATVLVAEVDLGRWNIVAALTIAFTKAVLIILFFMHIKYSSRLTWAFALAGFFWLGIMLSLAMTDYLTRLWLLPTIPGK